jgi:hypothetical protein
VNFRLNVEGGSYKGIIFSTYARNDRGEFISTGRIIPPASHNLGNGDKCGQSSVQHKVLFAPLRIVPSRVFS